MCDPFVLAVKTAVSDLLLPRCCGCGQGDSPHPVGPRNRR